MQEPDEPVYPPYHVFSQYREYAYQENLPDGYVWQHESAYCGAYEYQGYAASYVIGVAHAPNIAIWLY